MGALVKERAREASGSGERRSGPNDIFTFMHSPETVVVDGQPLQPSSSSDVPAVSALMLELSQLREDPSQVARRVLHRAGETLQTALSLETKIEAVQAEVSMLKNELVQVQTKLEADMEGGKVLSNETDFRLQSFEAAVTEMQGKHTKIEVIMNAVAALQENHTKLEVMMNAVQNHTMALQEQFTKLESSSNPSSSK